MSVRLYRSKGYALFLAVLPILLMYKVPLVGLGVSTTLIAVGMAYGLCVLLKFFSRVDIKILIPIVIYFAYAMSKSNMVNVLLCISICVHLMTIMTGAVDVSFLKKCILTISLIAAVAVIFQFLLHMIFGVHLPMIVNSLCLDDLEYYSKAILTGIPRNSVSYRPSAFFLEPAHFTMYCIVGQMIFLYDDKPDYIKAGIVSAGILATTSGMGIVLTAAIWVAFPFVTATRLDSRVIKRIFFLSVVGILSIIILMRMPFFQTALARITGPVAYSSTQYNAIWGRIAKWDEFIGTMNKHDFLWGYGNSELPDVYFTGLMTLIYSYGIIGTILFYGILLVLIIKTNNRVGRVMLLMYAAVIPLADIVGFINVIFYCGIAIALLTEFRYE